MRSEDAAIAETVFAENAAPKDDLELKHNKTKKVSEHSSVVIWSQILHLLY